MPTSGIVTFMVIDLPTLVMFLPNWSIDRWASFMPFLSCVVSAVMIALTTPTVAMTYRLIRVRDDATLDWCAASSFSNLMRAAHSVISADDMRSRSSPTVMPSSRANRK